MPTFNAFTVRGVADLHKGDQLALDRGAFEHHMIVIEDPIDLRKILVIHFSNDVKNGSRGLASGSGKSGVPIAEVRKDVVDISSDVRKRKVYRIDWHNKTFSPDETVQRAKSKLGEAKYCPFTNNCEHFANWCKTGRRESSQINEFSKERAKAKTKQVAREGAKTATETVVKEGTKAAGKSGGKSLGREIMENQGALGIGMTIAMEGYEFWSLSSESKKKRDRGEISKNEHTKQVLTNAVKGVASGTATVVGSTVGQTLIPIPFVGGMVGAMAGKAAVWLGGLVLGGP